MDYLLQHFKIDKFDNLLRQYIKHAGGNIGDMIDGGAGSGATSKRMYETGSSSNPNLKIFAYEPFVGNHRFFDEANHAIVLRKAALGSKRSRMTLAVGAVVEPESDWGRRGMSGYSSGGNLSDEPPTGPHDSVVEVVAADSDVPTAHRIGFVKLDLQGGEFMALKGMQRLLSSSIELMWIEYMLAPKFHSENVYDLLRNDFNIYDTEYLFKGEPSAEALEFFSVSETGKQLSNGARVWKGFKKTPYENFKKESALFHTNFGLIQTDICCVKFNCLPNFIKALVAAQ